MVKRTGLRLAENLVLPLELAVEATAVIGKRGRGKTFTGKRIVEEVIRAGVTVLIIDPTDVWWGLRSGADGEEGGGLDNVFVIGGRHGDLPVHETAGKVIARAVLDGTSMVLCPKGLSKSARRRLVGECLTELYDQADGTPILVVIDEADEYAPEGARSIGGNRTNDPLMLSVGAVEDIVRRGRAGGLGSLLITQRVAVLAKSVLEQSDTLIALGVTGKNDIDAVAGWIAKHAPDIETGKRITSSLPALPNGTAWVWSPEYGVLDCVQVLPISTFDSSRTPKVGEVRAEPKARKAIDLAALSEEMEKFAEQVKADDPGELKRRIADLERQLRDRPAAELPEPVQVPMLTDEDRELLGRTVASAEGMLAGFEAAHGTLQEYGQRVTAAVKQVLERTGQSARQAPAAPTTLSRTPPTRAKATVTQNAPPARPAARTERTSPTSAGSNGGLKQAERAILRALIQRSPLNYPQLGMLSGYSHTSSHFDNTVSALRTRGLIEGTRSGLSPTAAGCAAIPEVSAPVDDRAMLDMLIGRLKQAEKILFTCLLDAYPGSLDYPALGEASGYSAGSSHFDNTVSRLRRLDLIHGSRSGLTARDEFGQAWHG